MPRESENQLGGRGKGAGKTSSKGGKAGKRDGGKDAAAGEHHGTSGIKAAAGPTHEFSLDTRPYAAALQELFKVTMARPNDFDPKAVQLLDALHSADKSQAAIAHLTKSLEGIGREKVLKMKAFIFTLLRAFDKDVYSSMRESRGWPKPRRKDIDKPSLEAAELNALAPEFIPGQPWSGVPLPFEVPAVTIAHEPLLATAPGATVAHEAAVVAQTSGGGSVPGVAAGVLAEADPGKVPAEAQAGSNGTSTERPIVFEVECETELGESVAVLGNVPALGAWEVAGAKALSTSPDVSPVWKSSPVPLTGEVEYKFLILKEGKIVRWEPLDGNRTLQGGAKTVAPTKFGKA